MMGDNSTSMENLNLDTIRLSRDLLQRFAGISSKRNEPEVSKIDAKEEEEGDVELTLGLSLGGRFGVDKSSSSNKLIRSSSVATCLPIVKDRDAVAQPVTGYHTLKRTSSLPVESEVEWRKRKELQTLRRMEAKRRRSEKLRISRGDKGCPVGGGKGGGEEERRGIEVNWKEKLELLAAKRYASSIPLPYGLSSASRQASLERGMDLAIPKGKTSYVGGSGRGLRQPSSQGSIESNRGSSSSVSELDSKALQGSSSGSNLSPVSVQSIQEASNHNGDSSGGTKPREQENRTVGFDLPSPPKGTEEMPCVFTKGDGPNGSRVDGILYKYEKGEEVRIMCVCHGDFLSPAEFVKHAGGIDLAHPLKHIVINPNPRSFG